MRCTLRPDRRGTLHISLIQFSTADGNFCTFDQARGFFSKFDSFATFSSLYFVQKPSVFDICQSRFLLCISFVFKTLDIDILRRSTSELNL